MDIVTLGASLNGSAEYVNSHFKGGSNIQIVDNPDGTQTINASSEVSSEDTVARAEIAAIKDGETLDSFGDVETALDSKADTTDIPTVPITAIQKNGTGITPVDGIVNITVPTQASDINAASATQGNKADTAIQGIKVNSSTVNPDSNKVVNITVPTSAADVHALADTVKYAGASTAGGSATSAAKLDTASAGSATQPVYFVNGIPTATTYSLAKSVPADAVFTDTTYSEATTTTAGLMSAQDKTDLGDVKNNISKLTPIDGDITWNTSAIGSEPSINTKYIMQQGNIVNIQLYIEFATALTENTETVIGTLTGVIFPKNIYRGVAMQGADYYSSVLTPCYIAIGTTGNVVIKPPTGATNKKYLINITYHNQ